MVFAAYFWAAISPSSAAVDVWLTKGDKSQLLAQQPALSFQPGSGSGGFIVNVNPNTTYQTIDGFGAALTDSSAWLIQNKMNATQRNNFMNQIFSPTNGIGMSYLRIPMGASDFTASGHYTYNDLPINQTDIPQDNFSIAHDQQYIIPQLQQAKALNPDLSIMASPWSAPAWMKSNKSLIGGTLNPQYYSSYATYFEKFIDAYAAEGLTIDSVSMQNEPHHIPNNYPGTYMSWAQQADLIKNHVGPKFAAEGINTKIFLWDHNWDEPDYAINALNDPQLKQYVAGSAFHSYAGDVSAQTTVHNAHPDKEIHFTEASGGGWATNFSDNLMWHMDNLIVGNTRNWGQSSIYWNLALDENSGPYQGGCSNCRGVVTINNGNGNVTLNEEYYAIAHASKFVKPGAVRIGSPTYNNAVETVAFKNPDGSRALIAFNSGGGTQSFRIVDNNQYVSYSLPGKSVATFIWPSDGGGPVDPPDPGVELLVNPGFEQGGFGWTSTGDTGFHAFFPGQGGHASFFADQNGHNGSIFQTGIAAQPGEQFKFELSDTRIEANANANVQFGLQFYGAGESSIVGQEFVQLILPGYEINDGVYSIMGTSPAGTQYVRPVIWFDNAISTTGLQENFFVFDASLKRVASLAGDFDEDGDVDGNDFLVWQRTPSVGNLADWQMHYGESLPVSATASAVPEPTSLGLCLLMALGLSGTIVGRLRHPAS